jgi:hypothetical protein
VRRDSRFERSVRSLRRDGNGPVHLGLLTRCQGWVVALHGTRGSNVDLVRALDSDSSVDGVVLDRIVGQIDDVRIADLGLQGGIGA